MRLREIVCDSSFGISSQSRSFWVAAAFRPHPHDFAQSKNRRRSDVSRHLHGVAKCRESVSKCRENVVVGRFCVALGRFCVATYGERRIDGTRHNPRFGSMIRQTRPEQIGGLRSKTRLFGPRKPKKHPKKRFLSLRNCDLRRFWHRKSRRSMPLPVSSAIVFFTGLPPSSPVAERPNDTCVVPISPFPRPWRYDGRASARMRYCGTVLPAPPDRTDRRGRRYSTR